MFVRIMRVIGAVLALSMTLVLVAGIVIVAPDVERWRGVLPSLDQLGYQDSTDVGAADTLAWADSQQRKQDREQRAGDRDADGYSFLAPPRNGSGSAGHWCSSRTIGYRVDLTAARLSGLDPERELRRWQEAFDRWATASGDRYRFQYRGEDEFTLVRRTSRRDMQIIPGSVPVGEIAITYATARDEAGRRWSGYIHRGLSDTVGIGGIGPVNWSRGSEVRGLITTGTVIVDVDDLLADHNELPTVYVHEAGHALGLGHVKDPDQIMFTDAAGDAEIARGDRRGIRKLVGAACS